MALDTHEFAPFYAGYIKLVPETDLINVLHDTTDELVEQLTVFSETRANYSYAPGKWTMRQVLQHMIDTERIFAYRALSLARGEKQALPGFDENQYAAQTIGSDRSIKEMKEELLLLRSSSYLLFKSFSPESLLLLGNVNNAPVSVRAIGYMLIGHVRHHMQILVERYK